MGDRLTDEEFRTRLRAELARPELVSFVARTKGDDARRLVVEVWGEPRQATLTWSSGKKQTGQETVAASELPARAEAVASWDFFEVATTVDEVHAPPRQARDPSHPGEAERRPRRGEDPRS